MRYFIVLKIIYSAQKHVNSVMLDDCGYLFVKKVTLNQLLIKMRLAHTRRWTARIPIPCIYITEIKLKGLNLWELVDIERIDLISN